MGFSLKKTIKSVSKPITKIAKVASAPIRLSTASVAKAAGVNSGSVNKALGLSRGEAKLVDKYGKTAAYVGIGVAGGLALAGPGLASGALAKTATGSLVKTGVAGRIFNGVKGFLPALLNRGAAPADEVAAEGAPVEAATAADGINPALDFSGWSKYLPGVSEPTHPAGLVSNLTGSPQPIVIESPGAPGAAGAQLPPWWMLALIVAVLGWFLTGGKQGHHGHAL